MRNDEEIKTIKHELLEKYSIKTDKDLIQKLGIQDEDKGRFSIWSTECPSCKTGLVLLYEKGGSGKCDKCKRTFFTDYEEHPELGTPQTEYWLVD